MAAPRQLTRSEAYADSPTEATALWARGFRPFDEVWRVAGGAKNDLTDEGW